MKIEGLFPIQDKEYANKDEFHHYLIENYDPDSISHYLTVLTGITKYSKDELERKLQDFGFIINKRYGEVIEIKNTFGDEVIEAYLLYDKDTGIIYVYTNYRKTEEIPKIQDFLKMDKETYYLFLKPKLLRELTYKLIEKFEDIKIVDFTARRSPETKLPAKIRPDVERTISYWGDDGRFALKEMEYYYGILPDIVTFSIPELGKFRISSNGLFTYYKGNSNCMKLFLEIVESLTNEAKRYLEIYEKTSFEMTKIFTEHKSFDIPISTPSSIILERPLLYSEIENFKKMLVDEGYIIINAIAEEGSLFFSADILSDIGSRIRVKATERKIKLYPDNDRNLHTFMRFYEFIIKKVDPNAEMTF
ncbi:MAG: hypothetical protein J7K61_00675 [Thermoplasmata archaeon]|nr:hypothetical protein [Thermoplasmata archaeon]